LGGRNHRNTHPDEADRTRRGNSAAVAPEFAVARYTDP
jgi:hypothetical protein